jgi:hypothetical protein
VLARESLKNLSGGANAMMPPLRPPLLPLALALFLLALFVSAQQQPQEQPTPPLATAEIREPGNGNGFTFGSAAAPLRLLNLSLFPAATQVPALVVGSQSGSVGGAVYIYPPRECATLDDDPGAFFEPNAAPGLTIARDGVGGFTETYRDNSRFGTAVANLGDLDGDFIEDLAVGVDRTNEVFILNMCEGGANVKSVRRHRGFGGLYGTCIAVVGDVDQDGVQDWVVGARDFTDVHNTAGAVFLQFLRRDGSVKKTIRISNSAGGFESTGFTLLGDSEFGQSCTPFQASPTGPPSVVVSAYKRGHVYVIPLNSSGVGGVVTRLSSPDGKTEFGRDVCQLPDMDADGASELGVVERSTCNGGDCFQIVVYFSRGFPSNYTIISAHEAGAKNHSQTFATCAGVGKFIVGRFDQGVYVIRDTATGNTSALSCPNNDTRVLPSCGPPPPTTFVSVQPVRSSTSPTEAGSEIAVIVVVVVVVVCALLVVAVVVVRRRARGNTSSASDAVKGVELPGVPDDENSRTDQQASGAGPSGGEHITPSEADSSVEYGEFTEAFGEEDKSGVSEDEYAKTPNLERDHEYARTPDLDTDDPPVEYGEFKEVFGEEDGSSEGEYAKTPDLLAKRESEYAKTPA